MKNYSNPYQAPEVDKPRITPSEGMRGLFPTKDGWAEIDSKGNITKILTKDEFDAYKTDVSEKFDKKADKSDVTNVYKFKGSVENIEDVLIRYSIIPAGNPTINGEVVGSYDSEGIYIRGGTTVPAGDAIKVSVNPIVLNPGTYDIGGFHVLINGKGFMVTGTTTLIIEETTMITEVDFMPHKDGFTFENDTTLDRLTFLDHIYIGTRDYNGAAEIGDVYNETKTGTNYAWTGTSWDALGGEHKDVEAWDRINEISTTLANKADKSEITNIYKFKGSVDSYKDLIIKSFVDLIPSGTPTSNGEICGSFDRGTNTIKVNPVDIYYNKIDFVPEGNMTLQDGTVVANYENGLYNFSLGTNSEGNSTGLKIIDCTEIYVPIQEITLKAGIYKNLEFEMLCRRSNGGYVTNYTCVYFTECGYKLKLDPSIKTITQTDKGYAISEDTKINNIILWTTETDIYNANRQSYVFTGSNIALFANVDMAADSVKINIPIKKTTLKPGYYWLRSSSEMAVAINNMDSYVCSFKYDGKSPIFKLEEEIVVNNVSYIALADKENYESEPLSVVGCVMQIIDDFVSDEPIATYDGYYLAKKSADIMSAKSNLIQGAVYNTLDTDMNYAWTGDGWDALGGEYKDLEAREDIDKLETEMKKKANKEDVVSAYRFCGSVNKFDDLPVRYALIPNGVPTYKGEPCGTYDEKTHTVTVDDVMLEDFEDRIIVPIVPIEVKAGKYFCYNINKFGNAIIGDLDTYMCGAGGGGVYETLTEGTISHIEIFTPYGEEIVGGSTNKLGSLDKIIDSWIGEYDIVDGNIPTGAYDAGAIYEVKESGLSYGWTGSSWDALGTSHIDQEAREDIEELNIKTDDLQSGLDTTHGIAFEANERSTSNMESIENLETQMGNIESALDSIIEIQNGLIGGDSV